MATEPPTEDPTIKKIVLTTSTAPSATGGGEIKRRKTRRSKQRQEGGDEMMMTPSSNSPIIVNKVGGGATSPGTIQQLAASHIPGNTSSKAVGAIAPFTAAQATVGTVAPAASVGGAKPEPKVMLVKSRKAPRKLVLGARSSGAPVPPHHGGIKRKTVKKVKMSLSSLGKRLRRAKTIRKDASKKGIADIKKILIDAKLIKDDSKAPEEILRQMYADYMTLKKKAL